MPDSVHEPILRQNYAAPAYLIDRVDLKVDLGETETRVRSRLAMRRNSAGAGGPLVLDGRKLDADHLTLHRVPERFVLNVETLIKPQDNTELEGLYKSAGMFCTQCEAEGFRKITYFLDRPDVMSRYDVTITAERAKYPVLLSNGNLLAAGALEDGRHFARWEDPWPKPAYLFALVAGDLGCLEDSFTTRSGRAVALKIFTEHENVDKTHHAMASLKHSMKWDEDVYGLEYDLDVFMIVAVGAFNMGAMENKGLNVFNTKYVLARPDTATDQDYTSTSTTGPATA